MEFHPDNGYLELIIFDAHPSISREVFLSLHVIFDFLEPMDPDCPGDEYRASAEITGIPVPNCDWRSLSGKTLEVLHPSGERAYEGLIGYYEYFNAIDIRTISFGEFQNGLVTVEMNGTLDFTVEGLARLGKPPFSWSVELKYDEPEMDKVQCEFPEHWRVKHRRV